MDDAMDPRHIAADVPAATSAEELDQVYRKVGVRLLPILIVAYMLAYMDRVNISFAKLQMQGELGMGDAAYGFAAGVFFLGYVLLVAEGFDDCEGDLLAHVRNVAGPRAVVGATLDPHCHLSNAMVANADVLVCWKEYPHTDILDRARDLLALCVAKRDGHAQPRAAVADTGMVALLHTTREPARGFIDRAKALEGRDGVLSVSVIQGFPWGDVADMGSKILLYTDGSSDPDGRQGAALAARLAQELFDLRHALAAMEPAIDKAIDQALACDGTVVLADGADNAGGGAPSDSTFILRRLIERSIESACLGLVWDPGAVRIAFDAGEGAVLPLRIGGKVCPLSGDPVDAAWRVLALRPGMVMTGLAGTPAKLGDCALVETAGIAVVLTSIRCQAFNTDLFTQLGCGPAQARRREIVPALLRLVLAYRRAGDLRHRAGRDDARHHDASVPEGVAVEVAIHGGSARPGRGRRLKADAVVLGAGIIGVATAVHLQKRPSAEARCADGPRRPGTGGAGSLIR